MLIFLGSSMLKTLTITAYKIVENIKEGDSITEDFKPQATKDEFEDALIFCSFMFTYLGEWKYTEYKVFVTDVVNISYAYILDNVIGIETVEKFENKRDKHWPAYYNELSKFQTENGQVTIGQVINHLVEFFKTTIAEKPYQNLKEKITMHLSLNNFLNKDFQDRCDKLIGRNIQRDLTQKDIKEHFDEMEQIEKLAPKSNMMRRIHNIIFFIELYYKKQ